MSKLNAKVQDNSATKDTSALEEARTAAASSNMDDIERLNMMQAAGSADAWMGADTSGQDLWGEAVKEEAATPKKRSQKKGRKSGSGKQSKQGKRDRRAGKALNGIRHGKGYGATALQATGKLSTADAGVLNRTAPLLSFAGHALGDAQVAESDAKHLNAAAAKTSGDVLASASVATAQGAGRGGALTGGAGAMVATAADGFLELGDNAPETTAKLVTSAVANVELTNQLAKAYSGGVDALTAATEDGSAQLRAGEVVEEEAINGNYLAVPQAGTIATGLVQDRLATERKVTDVDAKTGRRGTALALGNWMADGGDPIEGPEIREDKHLHVLQRAGRAENRDRARRTELLEEQTSGAQHAGQREIALDVLRQNNNKGHVEMLQDLGTDKMLEQVREMMEKGR